MTVTQSLVPRNGTVTPDWLLNDLERSGITSGIAASAGIRKILLDELPQELQHLARKAIPERPFVNAYIIPYLHTWDSTRKFWRVRFVPSLGIRDENGRVREVKYAQPSASGTHLYIPPPGIVPIGVWQTPDVPVVLVEGEKKALCVANLGQSPALAVGGVDNWHTRTFQIPATDVSSVSSAGLVTVRTANQGVIKELTEQVAPELHEIAWRGRKVYIAYDNDPKPVTKENVARARFELAVWLEERGAEVSWVEIPAVRGAKGAPDDYLVEYGLLAWQELLINEQGFPAHPQPRTYISRELERDPLGRKVGQRVGRTVIASLDSYGKRYRDPNGGHYYFDNRTKTLHRVTDGGGSGGSGGGGGGGRRLDPMSSFASLLMEDFGLGSADHLTIERVQDSFGSVGDVRSVVPSKCCCVRGDSVYYQLSDSRVAKVTPGAIQFVDNGTDNVLFGQGVVEPCDEDAVHDALSSSRSPLGAADRAHPRWLHVLQSVNVQPSEVYSQDELRLLLAAQFYLSPWLRRWRGLMLPLEIVHGEPNSGKTFLYNLRRGILLGKPSLDQAPHKIDDWYAAISAAPGLWVCDNAGEIDYSLRNAISDELARLITDPDPTVSKRQYYTTNTQVQYRVDSAFAVTAVDNPFRRPDLLQRSLVVRLAEVAPGARVSSWYTTELNERDEWIADHLLMIQRFLNIASRIWSVDYKSSHRLVNYEQALLVMAQAMGYRPEMEDVVGKFSDMVHQEISDSDLVIQAIASLTQGAPTGRAITMSDIVEHAESQGVTSGLRVLKNPIALGRYVLAHKSDIEAASGARYVKRHNQALLVVQRLSPNPNDNGNTSKG